MEQKDFTMNHASLTSSMSSSAPSMASSLTTGHNGSASGGTQTPDTDMITMEELVSEEREQGDCASATSVIISGNPPPPLQMEQGDFTMNHASLTSSLSSSAPSSASALSFTLGDNGSASGGSQTQQCEEKEELFLDPAQNLSFINKGDEHPSFTMNHASLTSSLSLTTSSAPPLALSANSGHNSSSATGGTQTPQCKEKNEQANTIGEESNCSSNRLSFSAVNKFDMRTPSLVQERPFTFTNQNLSFINEGDLNMTTASVTHASLTSSLTTSPALSLALSANSGHNSSNATGGTQTPQCKEKEKQANSVSKESNRSSNQLSCSAVNKFDMRSPSLVQGRPWEAIGGPPDWATNENLSFINEDQAIGPAMHPSFAGPSSTGPSTATAEPESVRCEARSEKLTAHIKSEKLRKMKLLKMKEKRAKKELKSSHDYTTEGNSEEWTVEEALAALGEDPNSRSKKTKGSGSASSVKSKSAEKSQSAGKSKQASNGSVSTSSLSGGKNQKGEEPQQKQRPATLEARGERSKSPSWEARGEPSKQLPTSASSIQLSTEQGNTVLVGDTSGANAESLEKKVQTLLLELAKLKSEKADTEQTFKSEVEKVQTLELEVAKLKSEKSEIEQTLSAVFGEETEGLASLPQKEAIEKALECIVCLNVQERVLQCPRGHLICQTCHSSLGKDKTCPMCRLAYPAEKIRNLLAEQLAQTLNLIEK